MSTFGEAGWKVHRNSLYHFWNFCKSESISFFPFKPHPRTYLLILERGEGRWRSISVREKYQFIAFPMCPGGDRTHNLGMCPNWESNLQPFSLQDDAQPTEPHQRGLFFWEKKTNYWLILEREKERDLLFYLFMHSLVDSWLFSDQGSNPQPQCIGSTL